MLTTLIRTLILYSLIVFAMRMMGKRQLGELETSELVVAIMISDLAAVPMQDLGIPLLNGVIPIVTLYCAEVLLSVLCKKSLRFRQLLCGKPSIIISDGVINQDELKRLRISVSELLEELRLKDVFDITSVSQAYLETNGQLSVLLKPRARTVTLEDLGISTRDMATDYVAVIACGCLIKENLVAAGRDENWLRKELEKAKVSSHKDVFLLMLDNLGNVILIPKAKDFKPAEKDV